jgi:hypothetical protein
MIVALLDLVSTTRLSEKEIQSIFKLLGLGSEEERLKILNRFSFLEETKDAPLRIRGDNITTPYREINA